MEELEIYKWFIDQSMKIQIDSTLENISENVSKNILIKIIK